jgi:Inovirus Coat protein B
MFNFRSFSMNKFSKLALVAPLAVAGSAFAAGPDITSLTSAVDFGTVTAGVLSVGALAVGLYLAIKGAKIVIRMVKGA